QQDGGSGGVVPPPAVEKEKIFEAFKSGKFFVVVLLNEDETPLVSEQVQIFHRPRATGDFNLLSIETTDSDGLVAIKPTLKGYYLATYGTVSSKQVRFK